MTPRTIFVTLPSDDSKHQYPYLKACLGDPTAQHFSCPKTFDQSIVHQTLAQNALGIQPDPRRQTSSNHPRTGLHIFLSLCIACTFLGDPLPRCHIRCRIFSEHYSFRLNSQYFETLTTILPRRDEFVI